MKQDYNFFGYFKPNIIIYKLLGFWEPGKFKKMYFCYNVFSSLIWLAFLLSQIIYVAKNKKNVGEVTATLYVTVKFTIDMVLMVFAYKNMNDLKALMKESNNSLFQVKCQRHYDIAEDNKRSYRRMFGIFLYLGIQTDIFAMVDPFIGKERTTAMRGWFPYDWTKPFYFALTYILQIFVFIWNTLICLNAVMVTSVLLIQVGVQCDILCCTLNSLDNFFTNDDVLHESSLENKLEMLKDRKQFSESMTKNLVICIKHHKQIMRVAKEIERINGTGIFIVFIGGTLILCSSLFQLSVVKVGSIESIMLIFYLICMLSEQFLYCWFGNEVIYKSCLILESAYNTPWLDCDIKFRKILLQFMTQACQPISILTGGLFTMSVPVFITVLRTAYSYFTLLKEIQREE